MTTTTLTTRQPGVSDRQRVRDFLATWPKERPLTAVEIGDRLQLSAPGQRANSAVYTVLRRAEREGWIVSEDPKRYLEREFFVVGAPPTPSGRRRSRRWGRRDIRL